MSEISDQNKENFVNVQPKQEATVLTDDAHQGYNFKGVVLSTFLLFGPLLFGITIASIGNEEFIKRHFYKIHYLKGNSTENITSELFPSTVWSLGFLFPFGGWFGSLFGAVLIDKIGRKKPTIFFCAVEVLGSAFKVFSRYSHIAFLFAGRFCDGFAASGLLVSAVLLMFETLPSRLEKIYKPIIQILVNFGILLIGTSSLYKFVQEDWNMLNFIPLGISLILGFVSMAIPESPKYIYGKTKNLQKTENALRSLRGKYFSQKEVDKIKESVESSKIKQMSILEFLRTKKFRMATVSLIVLHVGQQLSGINSIMAFAPSLLKTAGFDEPDVAGVVITALAVFGSILFAPVVSRLNRKTFWLVGFLGMLISFLGFVICQEFNLFGVYRIGFLCFFVFIFQIGPGPVVWFIAVEMFPNEATGAAQGIAGFFNWFSNTLVFLLFPILEKKMKHWVLIIFIVCQFLVIIYSVCFLVETNKRTPDQILKEYNRGEVLT